MDKKYLTCIDCPKSCRLEVWLENNQVTKVIGNQCAKGEVYARQEVENPTRVLTTTVVAKGLALKLVPVRTDNPIPKDQLLKAMSEIDQLSVEKPVKIGQVIKNDLLGLGINVIATRTVLA